MQLPTTKLSLIILLVADFGLTARPATYKEVGGVVVVEAEHFDSRQTATDNDHHFVTAPDELTADDLSAPVGQYLNARGGKYLVNLPDSPGGGENRSTTDLQNVGPYADLKVQISTTGEYTLYLRDTGYDGSSDSMYIRIVELQKDQGGPGPDWYRYGPTPADGDFNTDRHAVGAGGWDNMLTPEVNDAGGAEVPATWTISKAGTYTIRVQQREDGNAIDAVVLQLSNLPAPAADIPESAIVGATPQPLAIGTLTPPPNAKAAAFNSPIKVAFVDGTTTLDPNSVVLKLDNAAVTPTKDSAAGITTFTFQPPTFLAPRSAHTVSVDYKDNTGKALTESWSFTVQDYVSIPPSWAVQADKSKPGFLVRTWQSTGQPNTITWSEEQLAGLHGDNTAADLSKFTDNVYGNAYFDENGTINYWNTGGEGNFPNDATQNTPGLANDGTNDDNYTLEIISFIELPAGIITMAVNSDDGFRTYALPVSDSRDQFRVSLGEFNGGRGVADTSYRFVVEKAGIYPFRTVYEEGGGDSAVEWFTVAADRSRHLINDSTDSVAVKSYRAAPGAAYVESVLPKIGEHDADPAGSIEVVAVDAANKIDVNSVKMTLDGTEVKPAATKTADKTTISFKPAAPFADGSRHTASVTFADSSTPPNSRTVSWSFNTRITEKFFVAGTLFIEAEDFNFDHGKYITDHGESGMGGKYPGGDYQDKGNGVGAAVADGLDLGIDYNEANTGSDQAVYRSETGVEAGKRGDTATPPAAGLSRGTFDVEVNHVVGWNDAGDWYNYTRDFPAPAKTYDVYAHLASGGLDENVELAQITSDPTKAPQTKTKLGVFKAPATGGWDTWHIVQLTDDSGNATQVTLGDKTTLRLTILPNGQEDFDYLAFVPGASAPTGKFSSIKLLAGSIVIEWTGAATLQSADDITGPWNAEAGISSPATISPAGGRKFYRLKP